MAESFEESNRLNCGKTNPGAGAGGCYAPTGRRSGDCFACTAGSAGTVGTNPFDPTAVGRARIILRAADGMGVRASGRELGVWPKTVRHWCKRWRRAPEGQPVAERLADAARSGKPATYTPEQICAVVAMTCEWPENNERPISQWSQREIADEAMRRGLVPRISQRSVGRF